MKKFIMLFIFIIIAFSLAATEWGGIDSDSIEIRIAYDIVIDSYISVLDGNDTVTLTIYCSNYETGDSILIYVEDVFQDSVTADSIINCSVSTMDVATLNIAIYAYDDTLAMIVDTETIEIITGIGIDGDSISFSITASGSITITSPLNGVIVYDTSQNIITEQYGFDGDSIDYWVNDTIIATSTGIATIDSQYVILSSGTNTITVWVYENRGFGAGGFGAGYFGVGYDGTSDSIIVYYEETPICKVIKQYTNVINVLKFFDRRLRRW